MPIRIVVSGANGRMGKLACDVITHHPELTLAGCATEPGTLADTIKEHLPDAVIDFTDHAVALLHATTIIESGCAPIIGTSGLSPEDIDHLKALCTQGGIIVPNFSITAVLMVECAKKIAPFLPDAAIIEGHHLQKKDAPSGTARFTAEAINQHRTHAPSPHQSTEVIEGALGATHQQTPIHALRLPGLLAEQQVRFAAPGEQLSIHHQTFSYDAFRQGIALACLNVQSLSGLHLGLEHLLTTPQ